MEATDIVDLVFSCALPLALLLLAFSLGKVIERAHLARLERQEAELATIQAVTLSQTSVIAGAVHSELVQASVVLSLDYFRTFISALKKIIGGELGAYVRLCERARREALVRLRRQAQARGAVAVVQVRFETSNVAGPPGGANKKRPAMVEIVAYGTAIFTAPPVVGVIGNGSPPRHRG